MLAAANGWGTVSRAATLDFRAARLLPTDLCERTLLTRWKMSLVEFLDDDRRYLAWVGQNAGGFVLNTRRLTPNPRYMFLHRADCRTINSLTGDAQPGGFTERTYRKVCATSKRELEEWVRSHGRPDGTFSARCKVCGP